MHRRKKIFLGMHILLHDHDSAMPPSNFSIFGFNSWRDTIVTCIQNVPVPVQRAVQQQQHGDPRSSGQNRTHPKTELTEVTVLDDGDDSGTAQEHCQLEERG